MKCMSTHHQLMNNHFLVEFFGNKPLLGSFLGLALTCLGFINNHDVIGLAETVDPYFMLLRDLGIAIGVFVSVLTLVGLLKKRKQQ